MAEALQSTEPAEPTPAEHHPLPDRRLLTLVGVMAAMFLSALDQTIVGVSMPRIIKELNGFDRYTWVTTVYLLVSTAVVPVVGKLSEQLGRKRVFLVGIAMFLLGSSLAGLNGWSYASVWPCIVGGAALIAGAMWHESRTAEAVLPPALFKSSIFSLSMVVTFIFGAVMLIAITFVPLFLQAVVGVSSTNSGLLMLPMMAGLVGGATGGGFLLSYTGRYRIQGLAGITAVTVGMYLLSRLNVNATQGEVD